jgi:leucyl-tRNA synthetase
VEGVNRFLSRLWRLSEEVEERTAAGPPPGPESAGAARELLAKAHWAIEKTTRDFQRGFQFNTVISAVMELVNDCSRLRGGVDAGTLRSALATAASLIFPFAPHTGADVYEALTGDRVWETPWPDADLSLLERDVVEIVAQVNGKLRDRFTAPASATREELEALARERPNVHAHMDGKQVVKVIVVPSKLVNFVVR